MRALTLVFLVIVVALGCGRENESDKAAPVSISTPTLPPPPPSTFREQSLVDRDGLEKMLGDASIRILDTRPLDEYATAHVPGAIRVDTEIWKKQGHTPNGLADTAFWGEVIGNLGIGIDTNVVVYGGRSLTNAARVWWHLRYAGVRRVMLLDGGWPLWQTGGKPTESGAPVVQPVSFVPRFQLQLHAKTAEVLETVQGGVPATIVDARSLGEYEGKDVGESRAGHIPGAVHVEWKELLGEDARFKSDDELRKLFEERGVTADRPVIAHCQSGGRASLEVFGLMLAGFKDARTYYGSWKEWSATEDAPVE